MLRGSNQQLADEVEFSRSVELKHKTLLWVINYISSLAGRLRKKGKGRKEERKKDKRRKEERKKGRKERRKEGRKEERKEGRKEGRKKGRKKERKEERRKGRKGRKWELTVSRNNFAIIHEVGNVFSV